MSIVSLGGTYVTIFSPAGTNPAQFMLEAVRHPPPLGKMLFSEAVYNRVNSQPTTRFQIEECPFDSTENDCSGLVSPLQSCPRVTLVLRPVERES